MDTIKVIKIGGKVAENEIILDQFLKDFYHLKGSKILVHGGGVMATKISEKLGIETKMLDGRRVTSAEALEVVTMVYGGLINKKIVAKLQAIGQDAIGLTGADLNIIHANKRNPVPIDFGWVGDVEHVKTEWLKAFLEQGVIPIIAPLTHDGKGNMLNTNADNIAGYLAAELAKRYSVELIFCFDRPGVMDGDMVIKTIDLQHYDDLKSKGIISDGMIPKLDLGFQSLKKTVNQVTIKAVEDLTIEESGTQLLL